MQEPSPLPLPDWPDQLRAQGRSIAWLARVTGATRPYLSAVASGHKRASPELQQRIALALHGTSSDRLASVRDYAAERARWIEVRNAADRLVDAITVALGEKPR